MLFTHTVSKGGRTVVGLMTGQNLLTAHVSRIGISNDDTGRKCREIGMKDMLEHLLSSIFSR